jgi:hypothetical protein
VDADGVTLATIQGLNQTLEQRLEQRLERLEQLTTHKLNGGEQ